MERKQKLKGEEPVNSSYLDLSGTQPFSWILWVLPWRLFRKGSAPDEENQLTISFFLECWGWIDLWAFLSESPYSCRTHADTREYYQLQRLINYQGWKGNSMVISLHSFVFQKKKTEACRSHHLVSPLKWKPWFLKDTKIGPRPLNQASDDLNQVSARMISSIAFFHVPLEGRHVEHVYVERDPPTTVASPFSCTW